MSLHIAIEKKITISLVVHNPNANCEILLPSINTYIELLFSNYWECESVDRNNVLAIQFRPTLIDMLH